MTALSITSMDPVCLEIMLRSRCPSKRSYGLIKLDPSKTRHKKKKINFLILRFILLLAVRNVGLRRSKLQKTLFLQFVLH